MKHQIETFRGAVHPWEIDVMGHMNVRHYMAKYDDATMQLFGRLGLTVAYFRAENRALGAVRQVLSYRKELFAGDLIGIGTEILEIGVRKLHFLHRMTELNSGEEAASAEMVGVHFDRETHRSTPFPEFVLAAARDLTG